MAPPPVRDGALRQVQRGKEVQLEHAPHFFERSAMGGHVQPDAGVVDENVNAPEPLDGPINGAAPKLRIEQIAGEGQIVRRGHKS